MTYPAPDHHPWRPENIQQIINERLDDEEKDT